MKLIFQGEWYGRFGNNIISLLNLICLAKIRNFQIQFNISHDLLNIDQLSSFFIYKNYNYDDSIILTPYNCFYKIHGIFENIKQQIIFMHSDIAKQYILPIIKDSQFNNDNFDDTLLIHIRGGDIFVNPQIFYIQPPLQYYYNIIDNSNYKNILIISEDKQNPCIDKLLEKYNNIKFQSESLLYDFYTLLNGVHIVSSNSTFIYTVFILSDKVKKIYYNEYMPKLYLKNVSIINYEFINYIYEWNNSPSQIKKMLNFPQKYIIRKFVNSNDFNIIEHFNHKKYRCLLYMLLFIFIITVLLYICT